jgi:hypothetical protein
MGWGFLFQESCGQLDGFNVSVNGFKYLPPCMGEAGVLVSCMDGWIGMVWSGLGTGGSTKRWMAALGMGVVCGSIYMS